MKYPMYAVRDTIGSFHLPRVDQNDPCAVRWFSQIVSEPGNQMSFAPGNFELYKVGFFDDQTGVIEPVNPVEFMCNGNSVQIGVVKDEK